MAFSSALLRKGRLAWWVPGGCPRSAHRNCLSSIVCAGIQGNKLPPHSRTERDNWSRDVWYNLVLSVPVFSFDFLCVGTCLHSVLSAAVTSNVRFLAEVYLWVLVSSLLYPLSRACPFAWSEIGFVMWFPVSLKYTLDWMSCGENEDVPFFFPDCWKILHTANWSE